MQVNHNVIVLALWRLKHLSAGPQMNLSYMVNNPSLDTPLPDGYKNVIYHSVQLEGGEIEPDKPAFYYVMEHVSRSI